MFLKPVPAPIYFEISIVTGGNTNLNLWKFCLENRMFISYRIIGLFKEKKVT